MTATSAQPARCQPQPYCWGIAIVKLINLGNKISLMIAFTPTISVYDMVMRLSNAVGKIAKRTSFILALVCPRARAIDRFPGPESPATKWILSQN